ncbi:MAG: hypothetical protein KatS3mg108_0594 [Isosphaeraceae bacterium]|jgi:hypothetical protein|nr:MAG: hypothetical protein KatS3mg108_0594 [Isosphaeraceae bacterium]
MFQRLAIPAWSTPPRTLEDWVAAFADHGFPAAIEDASDEDAVLTVESLGLRAFASLEAGRLLALDFDIEAADPVPVFDHLSAVTAALGWELHDESDDGL